MENTWTKFLKLVFLFISVALILICTSEISTRDSLLGHLESRRLEVLEELFNTRFVDVSNESSALFNEDETVSSSKKKQLEDNLAVTELMITEVQLLISQGVSTDISLRKSEIVKHYSSDPGLALTKLLRMKKETNLIKELQIKKDEEKDRATRFEIEIKSMKDRIARREIELKNIDKYKSYLNRENKEEINRSIVNQIKLKYDAKGETENELVEAVNRAEEFLVERLDYYKSDLYGLESRQEIAQSSLQRLEEEFEKENNKAAGKTEQSIFEEYLDILNPTKLPSDYLLAILFIFSGMLGAIVLTVRNDDYVFESKIIMIGVSTGLIIFLGVKGGPSIFSGQTDLDFSSINVYSSALFGIVGGLFSEKIYSVLNTLTTNIQNSIEESSSSDEIYDNKIPESESSEDSTHNKSSQKDATSGASA